jgi:hypothetical protein
MKLLGIVLAVILALLSPHTLGDSIHSEVGRNN